MRALQLDGGVGAVVLKRGTDFSKLYREKCYWFGSVMDWHTKASEVVLY